MNKIYNFSEIPKIRRSQNKLIFRYIIYAICFFAAIAICCLTVKNNIILTLIFAILSFIFILFSVCFWKIKYGVLREYGLFLDNMEMGNTSELICMYEGKTETAGDESFDSYIFTSSGESLVFLVHNQHSVAFKIGSKYRLLHVGKYLIEWEEAEWPSLILE